MPSEENPFGKSKQSARSGLMKVCFSIFYFFNFILRHLFPPPKNFAFINDLAKVVAVRVCRVCVCVCVRVWEGK